MARGEVVHWCQNCDGIVTPYGPSSLCPYCDEGDLVEVAADPESANAASSDHLSNYTASDAMRSLYNTFFGPRVDPRPNPGFIPGPEPWNGFSPHQPPVVGVPNDQRLFCVEWNGPIEDIPPTISAVNQHGQPITLTYVGGQHPHLYEIQELSINDNHRHHGPLPVLDAPWNGPGQHSGTGSYDHYQPSAVEDEELDRQIQQIQELSINDTEHQHRGPPPAPEFAIRNLPTVTISKDSKQHLNIECSVCQEKFESGSKQKIMPCKHIFHKECIVPWLQQNNTCPVCRHVLSAEDLRSSSGSKSRISSLLRRLSNR